MVNRPKWYKFPENTKKQVYDKKFAINLLDVVCKNTSYHYFYVVEILYFLGAKPWTGGEPMSIASLNVIPEDFRTSIIRVYHYEDKNLEGFFYSRYYGREIAFNNLTRLLLLIEDMLDKMECPQASVQSRRFRKEPKELEPVSMAQQQLPQPEENVIATFTVKVLFRQGASWQGKLGWKEGKQEASFRSVLELVKLMDSALPQPEICLQETSSEAADAG